MSEAVKPPFSREVLIEWGDCDPAGIVYYPRYFEMFDTSTAHLLRGATGLKKIDLLKLHDAVGFPMVKTGAQFYRPARYGDQVVIESRISGIGLSSFEVVHRLLQAGELAIEASETRVWVKSSEGGGIRSAPIPPEVATALNDFAI